jgi:hypothetical protein
MKANATVRAASGCQNVDDLQDYRGVTTGCDDTCILYFRYGYPTASFSSCKSFGLDNQAEAAALESRVCARIFEEPLCIVDCGSARSSKETSKSLMSLSSVLHSSWCIKDTSLEQLPRTTRSVSTIVIASHLHPPPPSCSVPHLSDQQLYELLSTTHPGTIIFSTPQSSFSTISASACMTPKAMHLRSPTLSEDPPHLRSSNPSAFVGVPSTILNLPNM